MTSSIRLDSGDIFGKETIASRWSATFIFECNGDIAVAGNITHNGDVLEIVRVEIDRVRVEHHLKPGTLGTFRIQESRFCCNTASCHSLRWVGCCCARNCAAHHYKPQSDRYQK